MKIHALSASLFLLSTMSNTALLADEHTQLLAQEYSALAHHFEQIGNRKKAIDLYTKALSFNDKDPQLLVTLGALSYEQQNIDQAIAYYKGALEHHHDSHILFNLGMCYQQQNKWSQAAKHFAHAVELDPTHLRAHLYAASAYEKLEQYDHALQILKQATLNHSTTVEAWHHLGNLYRHTEQLEEAIIPYKKALELQPTNIHLMMDLANILNMLNYNEASLELYQNIVEQNPNAISALYNFGFTLKKMDKLTEAQEVYLRVLSKKPDHAATHFSLAAIYLSLGDFKKGLAEYEWRWAAYNEDARKGDTPLWQGQELQGRTLFIYAEQGLGDTLQFIRYVKKVKETYPNCRIIFETQAPLASLLKLQPYIDHLLVRNQRRPTADYQIALMSLPRIFKTDLSSIPADIPYLQVDPNRMAFWKEKLAADTNIKIGVCWQGNARYRTQSLRRAVAAKSLPLQALKPLTTIPGVSLYSLQRIDGLDQIESCDFKDKLILFDDTFDKQYGAFMDTAAVIPHLDCVISVDTGVCHLAGALGIPTYILLPFPGDWRWLRNRSDSPWYPSVELFRQDTSQDWETPIQKIVTKLTERFKASQKESSFFQGDFYTPTPEQHCFFEELVR